MAQGSVFKRCTACGRRVDGKRCTSSRCSGTRFTWAFVVDVGRDADGRRRQHRRSGYGSRKEAERALRETLAATDQGRYVTPSDQSLADFLTDDWLPTTRPPRVRPNTYRDRELIVHRYINPRIGRVGLQQLTPRHLSDLYTALLEHGRIRGHGGLSPKTVRGVHLVLSKALKEAMRWGLIERNPAELVDPPSLRLVTARRRRAMRVWDSSQLRIFLAHVDSHRFYPFWLTAATTGMRRSELLGLRWADIDLAAAALVVNATLVPGTDGKPLFEELQKTRAGHRTVSLDAVTVDALRTELERQEHDRRLGERWHNDHGFVFVWDDGRHLNPDWVWHEFVRLADEAGLPRIRFHDLRHTHATLLLRAGVNPRVVSERLGHSSVAFTLDTYAHVLPGMQAAAADTFARLLRDAPESP
jgi:integrase